MKGRVLIVAGSDSGGGAGIQADIKTVTMLGAYAATAITALTAQNTLAVEAILPIPAEFVRRQMTAVLSDIGADVIKTGMLVDGDIIDAVADVRESLAPYIPLVVDPVMVSSTGTRLLDEAAIDRLKTRLIARAAVITPNLPEAEALLGRQISNLDEMIEAGRQLREMGPQVVVLTGGHAQGDVIRDIVRDERQDYVLEAPRIVTRETHGTGCTFASAIAAGLAQGMAVRSAIERAHHYVQRAIRTAPGFGQGAGPLNHSHPLEPGDEQ
jgi:hydroxymethylpyrimidine/phosphomethylpyrimidine kinase